MENDQHKAETEISDPPWGRCSMWVSFMPREMSAGHGANMGRACGLWILVGTKQHSWQGQRGKSFERKLKD